MSQHLLSHDETSSFFLNKSPLPKSQPTCWSCTYGWGSHVRISRNSQRYRLPPLLIRQKYKNKKGETATIFCLFFSLHFFPLYNTSLLLLLYNIQKSLFYFWLTKIITLIWYCLYFNKIFFLLYLGKYYIQCCIELQISSQKYIKLWQNMQVTTQQAADQISRTSQRQLMVNMQPTLKK